MPDDKITSERNEGVKRLVRLRDRRGRDERGLTLVEGVREVRQAMRAGWVIQQVYVCCEGPYHCPQDLLDELAAAGIGTLETSDMVFRKICYGERTEGVLAVVEQAARTLADLELSANPLVVVMESVEKPGNLGAVLRTCDGAGVEALLVCDERTDVYNPNIVRASLGAVFTVPVVVCSSREAAAFLTTKGIRSFAAVVQASGHYFEKDLSGPCAIVLGSEQDGLSDFWRRQATEQVRIPMRGQLDSLNVSVSAAIMVYEAVRQRAGGAAKMGRLA